VLAIRLARTGAKKKPTYRVVVIEKERARDGAFLEIVGHCNPRSNPAQVNLEHDRIRYWIERGAQPSPTVRRLIEKHPKQEPELVVA